MKLSCAAPLTLLVLAIGSIMAVSSVVVVRAQSPTEGADAKAEFMRLRQFDRTGIEPDARKPAKVDEAERNPFGRVSVTEEEGRAEGPVSLTDEQKLKRVLSKMRVGGVSGAPGSYKVLLGPLTLAAGDVLPSLFEGQGETIRVESVGDRKISFVFVERDNAPPRRFEVSIDLKPKVRSLLVGETFLSLIPFDKDGEVALEPLQAAAVGSLTENSKSPPADLQSLVDRSTEFLGDAAPRNLEDEPAESKAE
jgi:hypothetical protein